MRNLDGPPEGRAEVGAVSEGPERREGIRPNGVDPRLGSWRVGGSELVLVLDVAETEVELVGTRLEFVIWLEGWGDRPD